MASVFTNMGAKVLKRNEKREMSNEKVKGKAKKRCQNI